MTEESTQPITLALEGKVTVEGNEYPVRLTASWPEKGKTESAKEDPRPGERPAELDKADEGPATAQAVDSEEITELSQKALYKLLEIDGKSRGEGFLQRYEAFESYLGYDPEDLSEKAARGWIVTFATRLCEKGVVGYAEKQTGPR
jgi:hypothetical protein